MQLKEYDLKIIVLIIVFLICCTEGEGDAPETGWQDVYMMFLHVLYICKLLF